jgi:hypothetical protein
MKRILLCFIYVVFMSKVSAFFVLIGSPSQPLGRAPPRRIDVVSVHLRVWSQYAESESEDGPLLLRDTTNAIDSSIRKEDGSFHQLSSPREWLEYQEARNQGLGGAYTVMRCDRMLNPRKDGWRMWRKEFHWNRLCNSYRSQMEQLGHGGDAGNERDALHKTDEVLAKLLYAVEQRSIDDKTARADEENNEMCCVYMVTLLWQREAGALVVRGHCFSTGVYSIPSAYSPEPITACLAASDSDLPKRYDKYPCAKLSAWCRERRPLEAGFKQDGVGEVILVRNKEEDGGVHLLEGLTSNLFVLYRDGTLKTPNYGVLDGCARNLVMWQAERTLGWKVECVPIDLDSVSEWEEVFMTSAVRFIIPVTKILQGDRRVWSASQEPSKWRQLYDAILLSLE